MKRLPLPDCRLHSYNFGVDGMSAPESFYVMDPDSASKPRTLRWVFVEFDDLQVTIPSDYLRTQLLTGTIGRGPG